jgi:hypothetical protein
MFNQKIYDYILKEDLEKMEVILDTPLKQPVLDQLLAFAIKQNKLEAIKLLISYCANPYKWLQINNFYVKNYGNYYTREYFKSLTDNSC